MRTTAGHPIPERDALLMTAIFTWLILLLTLLAARPAR
jgi:hypothetical protein